MKKRNFFWLSVIIATLLIGTLFWKGDQGQDSVVSPDIKNLKADLTLYGVKYRRFSRDKAEEWIAHADVARFFDKSQRVEFEKVNVIFTDKNPKNSITIDAKNGHYDFKSGLLSLSGDVVVRGLKGYTLYAQHLFYFSNKKTIESSTNVRLIGENGNELTGRNMIYYIKKHKLLLYFPKAVIKEEIET